MSISLTGYNLDTLTFAVCASDIVAWQNMQIGVFDYELNTNYPNASCIDPITLLPVETLSWGTTSYNTSAIALTAVSDTDSTILCACKTQDPTISAIYIFNPYFPVIQQIRLSDQTVNVTALYQQVSTGLTKPINGDFILDWYVTPSTSDLSAVSPTLHLTCISQKAL